MLFQSVWVIFRGSIFILNIWRYCECWFLCDVVCPFFAFCFFLCGDVNSCYCFLGVFHFWFGFFGIVVFLFTVSCYCVVLVFLCGTWLCCLFGECHLFLLSFFFVKVQMCSNLLYNLFVNTVFVLILSSVITLSLYCLVAEFLIIITPIVPRQADHQRDTSTTSDMATDTD